MFKPIIHIFDLKRLQMKYKTPVCEIHNLFPNDFFMVASNMGCDFYIDVYCNDKRQKPCNNTSCLANVDFFTCPYTGNYCRTYRKQVFSDIKKQKFNPTRRAYNKSKKMCLVGNMFLCPNNLALLKQDYTKPNTTCVQTDSESILCSSNNLHRYQNCVCPVDYPDTGICPCKDNCPKYKIKTKQYGCPIKAGTPCHDYDKHMYEYEQWLKGLAEHQDSAVFCQGSDEQHCPHKNCSIYLEWKKQQKTR